MESISTDVVVIGGGFSGVVAAVRALEEEADVLLIEKGHRLGGTFIHGGGSLWVDQDAEVNTPVYEPFEQGIDWLRDLGIEVEELPEVWQTYAEELDLSGVLVNPPEFMAAMADRMEDMGGEIRLQTPMTELRIDDAGRVSGVLAADPGGEPMEINAGSVVLSTGGFAGNKELVDRITPRDTEVRLRVNPWSTGDGFLEAKRVGAKTTGEFSVADGHSMAAAPAQHSIDEVRDATMYYDTKAVALDMNGERFLDESDYKDRFMGIQINQELLELNQEMAFLINDHALYDSVWPHMTVESRIENAREFGAPCATAKTLDELCNTIAEYGVDPEQARATLETYNEFVGSRAGSDLSPPRSRFQRVLDSPPFYAVGVQAGVEFFHGGLDVDPEAAVLSRSASSTSLEFFPAANEEFRMEPIDGLYAAGVDIGRSDDLGYYRAGLSFGLSSGRIAGQHAAHNALKTNPG